MSPPLFPLFPLFPLLLFFLVSTSFVLQAADDVDPCLQFGNPKLRQAYIVLQAWKSAIFSDPFNMTTNWNGYDVCNYTGIFCAPSLSNPKTRVVAGIDLSDARIAGYFPQELVGRLTDIKFLLLSNNNLTGELFGICNAKFLDILDLSHNNFSGVIPQCIGSFSKSLSSLNLRMNKLHGTIPNTFAKGCALKNLNLNSNHLEGKLTPSITNCKDLQVLDVGNNKISDTFPHWIQGLPELQVLLLHSNKFHGLIQAPMSPRSLLKLRILDLSCNNFFGPLPTSYIKNFEGMINSLEYGKAARYMGEGIYSRYDYSVSVVVKGLEIELVKILTTFTSIDLSSNNFEGEIPRVIGELHSLRGLNLSHNNMIAHIPPSLGNLSLLEWLDLSSNKLDGQIPVELLDLTFLSSFNISDNQLVGPIPQGKQFNTFENGSYRGNEGLCGIPLSRGCSNNESPAPLMNSHKSDCPNFEFGWKVVALVMDLDSYSELELDIIVFERISLYGLWPCLKFGDDEGDHSPMPIWFL